ncbi:MAG TPA: protein translocase subunit SecD [Actinopolymorphaceae bacterium]
MPRNKSRNRNIRPSANNRSSKAPLARAIFTLVILAGSLYLALSMPVKLGLDLRGGTEITLETQDSPTTKADAEATTRTAEVLNRRIDALGVAEATLVQSGDRRIVVELPDVQDPRKALEVIGKTAQLSFHPVRGVVTDPKEKPKKGEEILPDEGGQRLKLGPAALTGNGVGDANAVFESQQSFQWMVNVDFKGEGRDAWTKLTADAACAQPGDPARRVAIVLDNKIISSPQVVPEIACNVGMTGGQTSITGDFDEKSAMDLAVLIKGGALPVPVKVIAQETVGPTLGDEAIQASIQAAIIGLALTAIFIIAVYRLVGFLATIALACYALISYATLLLLGATLTLPGLAGFVLAIGMAIDANVLVFERAREEYDAAPRRGLSAALERGFKGAWSAIVDSNVTTLLAAGLLFFLATGPVRGFGVTVTIGVAASMISALIIARVLVEWAVRRTIVRKRPGFSGLAHIGKVRTWLTERNPDLMKRRRLFLGISAAVVLLAIAGILVRGLDFGQEFTGGRALTFSAPAEVTADEAREAVTDAGFPRATVNKEADGDIKVKTGPIDNDEAAKIESELRELGDVEKKTESFYGPSLGEELRTKALIALGIALLAQMLYLAFRFRLTFGVSAMLSMFQNLVIVVGIFAWLGKPIDGVFLAAALSIIGWSVNDVVVLFDRVRELWAATPKNPFAQNANSAILQTVPRTVNTGIGALFILGALTVLGGDSLTDFALALFLGITIGTLSSAFTATPLVIELQARSKSQNPPRVKYKSVATAARRSAQREPENSGAVV